jgi:hypothetical protein
MPSSLGLVTYINKLNVAKKGDISEFEPSKPSGLSLNSKNSNYSQTRHENRKETAQAVTEGSPAGNNDRYRKTQMPTTACFTTRRDL